MRRYAMQLAVAVAVLVGASGMTAAHDAPDPYAAARVFRGDGGFYRGVPGPERWGSVVVTPGPYARRHLYRGVARPRGRVFHPQVFPGLHSAGLSHSFGVGFGVHRGHAGHARRSGVLFRHGRHGGFGPRHGFRSVHRRPRHR